jgi:hypothetical protein
MRQTVGVTTATRLSARQSAAPDPVCAEAVDLARAAAVELGGNDVGEHLGVVAEDERVVTHRFSCTNVGYRGWVWSVTVARAPRSKVVTVDEVVLLPGDEAILSPQWLPWDQRLRPGDLGVGDLMPTRADDPRLVPSWFAGDDDLDFSDDDRATLLELGLELGLGRPRVLSRYGRDEAADRWYSGDAGPESPMAKAAPGPCGTCGFYLPLAGSLRLAFGVCANAVTPDDGRVVSADHGCGAHSENDETPPLLPEPPPILHDTLGFDVLEVLPDRVVHSETLDEADAFDQVELGDAVDLFEQAELTDQVDALDQPDESAQPEVADPA